MKLLFTILILLSIAFSSYSQRRQKNINVPSIVLTKIKNGKTWVLENDKTSRFYAYNEWNCIKRHDGKLIILDTANIIVKYSNGEKSALINIKNIYKIICSEPQAYKQLIGAGIDIAAITSTVFIARDLGFGGGLGPSGGFMVTLLCVVVVGATIPIFWIFPKKFYLKTPDSKKLYDVSIVIPETKTPQP